VISRRRVLGVLGSIILIASFAGCGTAEPKLTELQRARSGEIEVILLARTDALKQGKDQGVLEFRTGSDHRLLDVGAVTASASMAMAGMAPMVGRLDVKRSDVVGRYTFDSDLSMAGTWRISVEWTGTQGKGSVTLPGTVR
jgi:hypothetical protein